MPSSKPKKSKAIGKAAEAQARDYLLSKGYTLLHQNLQVGRSELDLVMQEGNTLVFVEVKWRKNALYGPPESFVTEAKLEHLYRGAEGYMEKISWKGPIRFDIVAIDPHGIAHLKDIS